MSHAAAHDPGSPLPRRGARGDSSPVFHPLLFCTQLLTPQRLRALPDPSPPRPPLPAAGRGGDRFFEMIHAGRAAFPNALLSLKGVSPAGSAQSSGPAAVMISFRRLRTWSRSGVMFSHCGQLSQRRLSTSGLTERKLGSSETCLTSKKTSSG